MLAVELLTQAAPCRHLHPEEKALMVTVSAFAVVLITVVIGLFVKKIKAIGTLALGALLGLTGASTSWGEAATDKFLELLKWFFGLLLDIAV